MQRGRESNGGGKAVPWTANNATCYRYILAFGSNLGDRVANCQHALTALKPHVNIEACSPMRLTAPLARPDAAASPVHGDDCVVSASPEPDYVNFVADVSTALAPLALYRVIACIEDELGHSRQGKWLPRHMDIDILFWAHNNAHLFTACMPLSFSDASGLTIPHAGFWQRPFLQELMTDGLGLSPADLLAPQSAKALHRPPPTRQQLHDHASY